MRMEKTNCKCMQMLDEEGYVVLDENKTLTDLEGEFEISTSLQWDKDGDDKQYLLGEATIFGGMLFTKRIYINYYPFCGRKL